MFVKSYTIYYIYSMISKTTLRDEVKKVLLEFMFEGELKPGERIALPTIAKKLDVSVTPVREALAQLTESGTVIYVPNRGFLIAELNPTEAMEIYELIVLLEGHIVQSSSYTQTDIQLIEACNAKFESAYAKSDRLKYDMEFHQALIDVSSNHMVKKIIEDIRIRIFFYELEYMEKSELRRNSDQSHRTMIVLLKKGENRLAAQELANNWNLSVKEILTAFNHQQPAL